MAVFDKVDRYPLDMYLPVAANAWATHYMARLYSLCRHDTALVLLKHDCMEAMEMGEPL